MQFGYRLGGARRLLGLRRSLAGVLGDAVSWIVFGAFEEHWVTEDGHPVAR